MWDHLYIICNAHSIPISRSYFYSHFIDEVTEGSWERFSNLPKDNLPVNDWEALGLNLGHYDMDKVT